MIRLAKQSDLAQIVTHGERFFVESGYGEIGDYDPVSVADTLSKLIELDSCVIADDYSGGIAFVTAPIFMVKDVYVAQEIFWWVRKDLRGTSLGIKLLKAAERQAKANGADHMVMVELANVTGDLGGMYSRLGYKPQEKSHMRKL